MMELRKLAIDLMAYLIFGSALVLILLMIIKFFYSKKHQKEIEKAKYRMLDDDD